MTVDYGRFFKVHGETAYIEKRGNKFHVFAKVNDRQAAWCIKIFENKDDAERYARELKGDDLS